MTDNLSTEDIVSSAINESIGGGNASQNTTADNQTTETTTTAQPSGNDDGTSNVGTDPNQQSSQQPEGQQTSSPFPNTRLRDDGKGNLVDMKGNLVAHAGAERRWFNEARRLERDVAPLRTKVSELEGRVQAYDTAFKTFQDLGLTPDQVSIGAKLVKAYNENPQATIQYLLTDAKARGINVDIGAPGVDAAAIQRMVQQAVSPLLQDRERIEAERKAREEADKEYTSFVDEFPDALLHEDVLAAMVKQSPNSPIRELYYRLKAEVLQQGFNWNQNLRQQWEARRAQGTNTMQQQPQSVPQRSAPLPNGRPAGGVRQMGNTPIAPASTTSRDIVREAMREAGINVG